MILFVSAFCVDIFSFVFFIFILSILFVFCFVFFFFFSSRRRHTRLVSDWSSDVCSSDLSSPGPAWPWLCQLWEARPRVGRLGSLSLSAAAPPRAPRRLPRNMNEKRPKIGRASCRERV